MTRPDGFFSDDKGATAVTVWTANPEEEHCRLYTVIQTTCYKGKHTTHSPGSLDGHERY